MSENGSDIPEIFSEEKHKPIKNNEDLLQFIKESKSIKEIEEALSRNGVSLNYDNGNEGTALHVAAQQGNKQIISLLINKGADITKRNQQNKTPVDIVEEQIKKNPFMLAECQTIRDILNKNIAGPSGKQECSNILSNQALIKIFESNTKTEEVDTSNQLKKGKYNLESHSDKTYKAFEIKQALDDTFYQVKLLMFFIIKGIKKQYDFRVATEIDAKEKFTNVLFKYIENNNKVMYRVLLAKHRLKTNITCRELASSEDDDFSLQKYFILFYKIKNDKYLGSGNLKDLILCTNTDFNFLINKKCTNNDEDTRQNKEIKKWEHFFDIKNISEEDYFFYVGLNECEARFKVDSISKADLKKEFKVILEKKHKDIKEYTKKSSVHKSKILNANQIEEAKIIEQILGNDFEFEENLNEFINKFRIIINYPNKQEITDYINFGYELNLLNLDELNLDLVKKFFETELFQWLKNEQLEAHFYPWKMGIEFLSNMRDKINVILLRGVSAAYLEELESYRIHFKPSIGDSLKTFLCSITKQVYQLKINSNLFGAIMLLEHIKSDDFKKAVNFLNKTNGYIFIPLKFLLLNEIYKLCTNVFELNNSHHLLVISFEDQLNIDLNSLLKDIKIILEKNPSKKVILVTPSSVTVSNYIPGIECIVFSKKTNFDELTDNSKLIVLGKNIEFQGEITKLNKIININIANLIINESVLLSLLKNNFKIENTKAFYSNGFCFDFYIKRSFCRQQINTDLLKIQDSSNLFLIPNNTIEQDLIELGIKRENIFIWNAAEYSKLNNEHIILTTPHLDNIDIFKKIFHLFPRNTVYWLQYDSGKYYVINTLGNAEHMQNFIKAENIDSSHPLTEEDLSNPFENNHKVVVLVNDSGVGKSTVLTSIARRMLELTKQSKPLWIARLKLNDFTNNGVKPHLRDIKFSDDDVNDAVHFVIKMILSQISVGENYEFIKQLLTIILKDNKTKSSPNENILKIVIFFEGFDEICPMYKFNTINLLKSLKKSEVLQMWVTTRTHEKVFLENELGFPSFSLYHLTLPEQELYLSNFWKWKFKHKTDFDNPNEVNETDFKEIIKLLNAIDLNTNLAVYEFTKDIIKIIKKYSYVLEGDLFSLREKINKINFSGYVKHILSNSSSGNNDINTKLLSVPLNLAMFGEIIFYRKFQIPNSLSLVSLYENFINAKVDNYFSEKIKTNNDMRTMNINRNHIVNTFWKISVKQLLVNYVNDFKLLPGLRGTENLKLHLGKDQSIEKELLTIGLQVLNGNICEFNKRSFAEFFFSQWIFEFLTTESIVQDILFKIVLLQEEFAPVRIFFNEILNETDVPKVDITEKVKIDVVDRFYKSDHFRHSPLHVSAKEGHQGIIKLLIDIFSKSCALKDFLVSVHLGHTPLHLSIEDENFEVSMFLLNFVKTKFNNILQELVLSSDKFGQTILHLTVTKNDGNFLKWLLTFISQYTPDIFDYLLLAFDYHQEKNSKMCFIKQMTALHLAVLGNDEEFIRIFLEIINKQPFLLKEALLKCNREKLTPLELAIINDKQKSAKGILAFLIDKNADLFKLLVFRKSSQKSIVQLAVHYESSDIINVLLHSNILTKEALKKELIDYDDNVGDCSEWFPETVLNSMENSQEYFIHQKKDTFMKIILDFFRDDPEFLEKFLLKFDFSRLVSIKHNNQSVIMLLSYVKDRPDFVKKLLLRKKYDEKSMLEESYQSNNDEIIQYIKSICNECESLIDNLKSRLNALEIVEQYTSSHKNAFCMAVCQGDANKVNEILINGNQDMAQKLIIDGDEQGSTALDLASEHNHLVIFDLLLRVSLSDIEFLESLIFRNSKKLMNDCKSNEAFKNFGFSVLNIAIQRKQCKFVETIIKYVLSTSSDMFKMLMFDFAYTESDRYNGLLLAVSLQQYDIVKVLLKYSAEQAFFEELLFQHDFQKRNILHIAVFDNNTDLIALFLNFIDRDIFKKLMNSQNLFKLTPIVQATNAKHWSIIATFIKINRDSVSFTEEERVNFEHFINKTRSQ